MRWVFNGLVVNTQRMYHNSELLLGLPYAQNLMLKLAESLGRDEAHKLVSEVATRAYSEWNSGISERDFREQAMTDRTVARVLDERQVREAFDPDVYLREAIAEVDRMVESTRSKLQARKVK